MKRFYKLVSTRAVEDGFHILLDARPVKTKSGAFLLAPNEAIANHLMKEWADQDEHIIPYTMPYTQILNTKIDRVSTEREVMSASILKYLDTDLICYFATEPEELVKMQQEQWHPWIEWFEGEFDCKLKTITNLAALTQEIAAHQATAKYVHNLDDDRFTILQIVTSVSGSLILSLALVNGIITAQQLFDACYIEEDFKDALYDAEKYGKDPIIKKAQKSAMQDFVSAQDYIALMQ